MKKIVNLKNNKENKKNKDSISNISKLDDEDSLLQPATSMSNPLANYTHRSLLNNNISSSDTKKIIESKPRLLKFFKISSKNTVKFNEKKNNKKRNVFIYGCIFILLLLFLIIGILAINFIVLPAKRLSLVVEDIQYNEKSLLSDFKNKDLSKIDMYFQNIQNDLDKINTEIDKYNFLANLSYTKGYYDNFQIGRQILAKTNILLQSTLPELKSVLKVTGFNTDLIPTNTTVVTSNSSLNTSSSSSSTAILSKNDSSVTLIMKELPTYLSLYSKIQPKIQDILSDFKKIDLNYVPSFGGGSIKNAILNVNDFSDQYPSISDQITNFLKNLPQLIGSNKTTRFLIFLQNHTELRSSGGLITAYGYMELNNGEIGNIFMSDITNLEAFTSKLRGINHQNIYGQKVLMLDGCGGVSARVQDSPQYPDLYNAMDVLRDYYDTAHKYDSTTYPDYDYILMANDDFANNLIGLIQPLKVEGYGEVTGDNLYDFIKLQTDDPKHHGDPNRKSIIKEIANAAKKKLLDLKVKDFPNVINTFVKSIQAKDLAFASFKDPSMQTYFDRYGMSGRTVKDFKGDYLEVGEAQNCSLKLNRWVKDSIKKDVYIQNDGSYKEAVDVHWIQPQLYSPSFEGQYDKNLTYRYRAWVRFFLPVATTNIISNGYVKSGYHYYQPLNYYDSVMDKQVNDNIIQFDHRRFKASDPIDKLDLNVTYNLPKSINYNTNHKYSLLIQKHPGKSWGEGFKINIHDQNNSIYSSDFIINRDKVLTFQGGIISVDGYDKSLDWITDLVSKVDWNKLSEKKN